LTLRVTGQYNICTIQNAGSGYSGSTPLPTTTTGGTGSGMTVNFGYGLGGQLVSVAVSDPGTGYSEGDVISVNGGSGTFVITKYNSSANQANNNTAPTDWTFGVDGNITLPNNYSSINYANGSPYGGGGATGATGPTGASGATGPAGPQILYILANANLTATAGAYYQIENSVANANINFTLPDGSGLSTGNFVRINPYALAGANFQYFVVTNGANSASIQGLSAPLSANTPTTFVWGGGFWYYSN
jgi:hypothetical protein